MTSVHHADFARDLAPYRRAVGELIRLSRSVPGGVDRLREWQAAYSHQLVDTAECVVDGGIIVEVRPSGAMLTLLAELRGRHQSDHARSTP